ncbi:uncharacterized protein K460DRAFT_361368, partial [Cucurbitaria berberidis CBS 394.84]
MNLRSRASEIYKVVARGLVQCLLSWCVLPHTLRPGLYEPDKDPRCSGVSLRDAAGPAYYPSNTELDLTASSFLHHRLSATETEQRQQFMTPPKQYSIDGEKNIDTQRDFDSLKHG